MWKNEGWEVGETEGRRRRMRSGGRRDAGFGVGGVSIDEEIGEKAGSGCVIGWSLCLFHFRFGPSCMPSLLEASGGGGARVQPAVSSSSAQAAPLGARL